jgi:glucokinase
LAIFAVDAGGTRIKLGVVEDGKILSRSVIEARSDEGLRPQLPRIAKALRELAGPNVEGLGMAFPSLVDSESGRVTRDSGKYRDAMGIDLRAWVDREFGVPFQIENDARMAAIGEWRYGAGRGVESLVMFTLGTGIGTGVILEGRILRGKHGQAGCLGGHMIVNAGGHLCPCGAIGCAEAEASTAALPGLAAEDPEFESSPLPLSPQLDYQAVFAAATQGDPCAIRLRDRGLLVWGSLAVSLVNAFDPEMVVFGGGILAAGEAVLGPIRRHIERDAWMPSAKVRVVAGELGDDAALLGCGWLAAGRAEEKHEITFA